LSLVELAWWRRNRQDSFRPCRTGGHVAPEFFVFLVDRWKGAGLIGVGADRDAGRDLLLDPRLACDDQQGRQLGAGAPTRHRASARPRDRRGDRRFSARTVRRLPRARLLLRDWPDVGGVGFRAAHRSHRRRDHVRSLYRLDDRADDRGQRGDCAILAGLGAGHACRRHFPGRAVHRGQPCLALICWRARRIASGLADLRHVRVRLSLRLRGPSDRRAAWRCNRRVVALRAASIFRQPPLYRGQAELMSTAPRQLALALDHAESFAREDFLSGQSNAMALALIDSWPRWPSWPDRTVMLTGPEGSGKSHLAAIWAQAAGARLIAARALEEASVPSALATGALVVEDVAAGAFDERALFHLLNLAREDEAF